MGMPPLPPGAGAPPPPAGGPPMGGGGPAMPADLGQLVASLPPQYQGMIDPKNPITVLMWTRLRKLSDEQGDALLNMVGQADPHAIAGLKAFLPELMLLLDLFDDGELNNSVGDDGSGAGGGAPPMPPTGGPRPPPTDGGPGAGPVPPSGGAPYEPDGDEGEEEDNPYGAGASSLRGIRA